MAQDFMTGLQNVGQFLQSPQMPVLAGQLGAAAMGPNQNTWQSMVGRVASDYGKSNIAATEAQAQANKSAAMNNWLKQILPALMGGVNLTPEGTAGPTDTTIKINADGTFSSTTKGDTTTKGGNAPAGATSSGQMDPKAAQPVAPTQAPMQGGVNPRALPF